ncbi:MAG TPA: acetate/propionate family kinase [Rugosimonospora sp.]|nr:acetate/propionate family kinase [Rugosimonospora sp.]
MNPHYILALNSGSSSLKFAVYEFDGARERLLLRGEAENIGAPSGHLWLRTADGSSIVDQLRPISDHQTAVQIALDELKKGKYPSPAAIGHRVVNGGRLSAPQKITPQILTDLRNLVPLAPLHLPAEIKIMEAVASQAPQIPQVACFDTAFHRRLPELAQRFPLPRKLFDEGLRRYGFHGLSYEYVLQELGSAAKGQRLVIAHLGNGCSLAAVRDGSPVDTSMGLTPTGGVMMGTRTGDLDPGILIYLLREKGYDAARLERLVDAESGLLGVSELASDMKTLLAKRDSDARAAEAVAMFCRSIRKEIGAFAAVLGGLDILVFTGGIGERAPAVRDEICRDLGHLGVRLDPVRNNAEEDIISAAQSACLVRVVATNEELMIARHTRGVIFGNEA